MGYGGMAAVLVAMLAALTVLPALLARARPADQRAARTAAAAAATRLRRRRATGGWARLARSVMRRPVLVPRRRRRRAARCWRRRSCGSQFGGFDERVLPAGTAEPGRRPSGSHAEFPGGTTDPITCWSPARTGGR